MDAGHGQGFQWSHQAVDSKHGVGREQIAPHTVLWTRGASERGGMVQRTVRGAVRLTGCEVYSVVTVAASGVRLGRWVFLIVCASVWGAARWNGCEVYSADKAAVSGVRLGQWSPFIVCASVPPASSCFMHPICEPTAHRFASAHEAFH